MCADHTYAMGGKEGRIPPMMFPKMIPPKCGFDRSYLLCVVYGLNGLSGSPNTPAVVTPTNESILCLRCQKCAKAKARIIWATRNMQRPTMMPIAFRQISWKEKGGKGIVRCYRSGERRKKRV